MRWLPQGKSATLDDCIHSSMIGGAVERTVQGVRITAVPPWFRLADKAARLNSHHTHRLDYSQGIPAIHTATKMTTTACPQWTDF